jgi:hypothetical protein
MISVAIVISVLGAAFGSEYDLTALSTNQFTDISKCPNVTVIHKVTRGEGSWYDGCEGLIHQQDYDNKGTEGCQMQCHSNFNCSVWQYVKSGNEERCWSGSVVHHCHNRGSAAAEANFKDDLLGGERIQHGFIEVVQSGRKVETLGLRHYPEDTGTTPEQVARCKTFCETDVTCTVWQFGGEGKGAGCWLEHGPNYFKGEEKADSDFAKNMVDGETLKHVCPPYVPPEPFPWAWVITGVVLGLIALGAIIYVLLKPKPKTKKTRAVKISPPKEEWREYAYLVQAPTGQLFEQRGRVKVTPEMKAQEAEQQQPLVVR